MPTCEICGKSIQNRQALEMHKRWKHPKNLAEDKPEAILESSQKAGNNEMIEVEIIDEKPTESLAEGQAEDRLEATSEHSLKPAMLEIEPIKEDIQEEEFECINCGIVVFEGQKFCTGCGNELDWDEIYD